MLFSNGKKRLFWKYCRAELLYEANASYSCYWGANKVLMHFVFNLIWVWLKTKEWEYIRKLLYRRIYATRIFKFRNALPKCTLIEMSSRLPPFTLSHFDKCPCISLSSNNYRERLYFLSNNVFWLTGQQKYVYHCQMYAGS